MSILPEWAYQALSAHKVQIVRYGRDRRGRPNDLEKRWFFCGWYYHREIRKHVVDGPIGPFPCMSAAMSDAIERYGLTPPHKRKEPSHAAFYRS